MVAGIRQRLGSLVDVRRDEISRIVPLTLAYGLVMASLYVLKPARNALFLDQLGVGQLPYVLLLVALIGGVVAALFARLTGLFRLDRLIVGTFLVLAACLLGFRALLPYGWGWSFYLFYVWVNLYGLMATSLLWLLANVVFNPREARRLFGVIGTAGIAGSIIGGALTSAIVGRVGTENLLLVCAALLGGCLGLLRLVPVRGSATGGGEAPADGPLTTIARSDLLRLLGTMAALVAVVAAVIDVQFNDIVDQAFADKDAKTAFFGQFFALLGVFAFIFQLWATPRILRALGVVSALFFLPVSMGMGALAVLLVPGLASGVLLKLGDGGLRHSLHKSAVEILSLPVPADAKRQTKVLLDTTVDNVATGVGALLVLALTAVGVSYQHLSWVSLALVALWVLLVYRSRGAYTDAFRQALMRRTIDISALTTQINEAAALDSLVSSLTAGSERQVVYALDMLAQVRADRLMGPATQLLDHPAAAVRLRALRVLSHQRLPPATDVLDRLLHDEDLDVRAEALYSLCAQDPGRGGQRLQAALRSADSNLRAVAAACLAAHTDEAPQLVDESFLRELMETTGPGRDGARLQVARLLGSLGRAEWRPLLLELLEDQCAAVVEQAITSTGLLGDPADIGLLVAKLADRRYRSPARQALSRYGAAGLEELGGLLLDPRAELRVRLALTRVLSDVHEQAAVEVLLGVLGQEGPLLELLAIRALSRLRSKSPELAFDEHAVEAALERDLALYFRLFQAAELYRPLQGSPGTLLLKRVLAEKHGRVMERIFRLLGLQHNSRDIYHAYLGLVSGQPRRRANALEFLDNVLPRSTAERLLPLLDYASADAAIETGARYWGRAWSSRHQSLEWLLAQPDGWLRACAAYSAGETDMPAMRESLTRLEDDPDDRAREAAARALALFRDSSC
jgi:ATP:ADP antiporter, AAA family